MVNRWTAPIIAVGIAFFLSSCGQPQQAATGAKQEPKIGVLLANHGSEQKSWRDMLVNVEDSVRDRILANPRIGSVKTAFMEYTEPSIATRMKEFDAEGYDEVIVVPLFVTVSGHTNTDIPHIVGLTHNVEAVERLRDRENIEVYKPRAKVTMASTIDATQFLTDNIVRRTKQLLKDDDGANFGVTLAAYGDKDFNQQWEALMAHVGESLMEETGVDMVNYAWSGHLVNYSVDPTKDAINQVLAEKDGSIVISVYVAYDYMFQKDIIGEGTRQCDRPSDVRYIEKEAILPDENLNNWVVDSVNEVLSVRQLAAEA